MLTAMHCLRGICVTLVALTLPLGRQGAAAEGAADPASEPALLDAMDGPKPVLRLLNSGAGLRLELQEIVSGGGGSGGAAEHLKLVVPAGSSAQVAYQVPPASIIKELRFSVSVACNRPGIQLAVQVALPRSPDPTTGKPRELLVRSGDPSKGGGWQRLTLDELPEAVARHARVARAQYGSALDERGAYVTQLIILAPGGPGETDLWVDEVAMHGVLRGGGRQKPSQVVARQQGSGYAASGPQEKLQTTGAVVEPATPAPSMPLAPAIPRIIQWQGEPFALLRQLGFNAVWMGRLPSADERTLAARAGLYLVCPPPTPAAIEAQGLDGSYDPVLAWDLGEIATQADVAAATPWAAAIARRECRRSRPIVLRTLGATQDACRVADVLAVGRPMLGTTLSFSEYAVWLGQQRRLSRPGTPLWATVETQYGPRAMAELAATRGRNGAATAPPAPLDFLCRIATASFTVESHGFFFKSDSSLASPDEETRMRAIALELTNSRLGLAEPWLASGKRPTGARSSRPEVTALVLTAERSRLIVPLQWSEHDEGAWPASASLPAGSIGGAASPGGNRDALSFVLPGAPESSDAWLVSLAGASRLPVRRITGGLEVTADRMPEDAFILITEDAAALAHVEQYLRLHEERAAQIRIELALIHRRQAGDALAQLPPEVLNEADAKTSLGQIDGALAAIGVAVPRADRAEALAHAAEADAMLELLLRRVSQAIAPDLALGVSPVPLCWSTLPDLLRVSRTMAKSSSTPQSMAGGEFEDLGAMLQTGWQRSGETPRGVVAAVRLSPDAPASGRHCLELEATVDRASGVPPQLASPPVWMTSPPLEIPAGQLVEITGQVRVRELPLGTIDPLLVFDSLGGEESAIRLYISPSWTPFRIIRAAAPGRECRVTIALGGAGRAEVDSLRYRFIPLTPAAPAEQVGPLELADKGLRNP